jgi:glyoxylase-like metal-dependent hydrolase (beta-lactamase superfamily II)
MMSVFQYSALDLYNWLTSKEEVVVVDVRNTKEFAKFKIEGPYPFTMLNIPYFDFMEFEEESISKIPQGSRVRIVCAKEASAKYVADIIHKNGFDDVGYLQGGINTWGNLLVPRLVTAEGCELYQFVRPGKGSCSYGLLYDGEIMLFDPSRNMDFYLDFADRKNCRIVRTFETHLQADYIAGSRIISERTGAELLANEADFSGSKINYTRLENGAAYHFSTGGPVAKAMFTPGHTPGSTSFLINEKYLLSGDTIFIKSIGRPDLGGKAAEWARMLFATLNGMKKLGPETLILPGHFIDWDEADRNLVFACTLDDAIRRNQDIYDIETAEEFVEFIEKHMRPQPEEYTRIRLINANLEQVDEDEQNTLDIGKNECAASAYAQIKAA